MAQIARTSPDADDVTPTTSPFVVAAVNHLATQLSEWDYEITNEAELCHLFFSAMIQRSGQFGVAVRDLKAEVRLYGGGSVDLGVRRADSNHAFSGFLEAKV